jgi:sialic acid synthase SpsE
MSIAPIPFGRRFIGPGYPVVIVAEIGINHEGDMGRCRALIQAAAEAGADAVKLQSIDSCENYTPDTESFAVFSRATLSPEETAESFALARTLGMEPFTTCGDLKSLSWVDRLEPAAHKISSGLITHVPLIRCAAQTGRPLIFSTGMSGLPEIDQAIRIARASGATHIAILQCTSIYPSPPESLHLHTIRAIQERYAAPAGFSDHSMGWDAAPLAVAAGAFLIEKHFSLDPSRPGFDHHMSLDSEGLRQLVAAVRKAEICLGSATKVCSPEQETAAQKYLRSIVARRDIHAGEPLNLENTGFMRTRPEKRGLPPSQWEALEGRQAKRHINRYQAIRLEDVVD